MWLRTIQLRNYLYWDGQHDHLLRRVIRAQIEEENPKSVSKVSSSNQARDFQRVRLIPLADDYTQLVVGAVTLYLRYMDWKGALLLVTAILVVPNDNNKQVLQRSQKRRRRFWNLWKGGRVENIGDSAIALIPSRSCSMNNFCRSERQ